MSKLTLYHYPLACSFVTLNALEEAGLAYEDEAIDIFKGQQKSPEYLKIHPFGKVPALKVGEDTVLYENAAILMYLDALAPQAGLLPGSDETPAVKSRAHADLIWCSSTLHPAIRQHRMPIRFTTGDPAGVKADGIEKTNGFLQHINGQLENRTWWFGDDWSIVDVYVNWCYTLANNTEEIEIANYASIVEHSERVRARPSHQRATARGQAAKEAAGILYPFEQPQKS
ncbi:MAG: glutathione S-transferase family protein [Pseudomonadota bacterium]